MSLLETSTITNDSPASLSQTVSNTVTKKQTFELSFSNSVTESRNSFFNMTVETNVGFKFPGLGGEVSTDTNFGWNWSRNETTVKSLTTQTIKEQTYTINKTVNVPAHSSVKVISYVNWIENLSIPYKAKLTFKGIGPSFENKGALNSNVIKVLLSKTGFNDKLLEEGESYVTFETHGQFTGSFGLDSVFSVTSINGTQNFTNYEKIINKGVNNNIKLIY